MPAFLYIGNRSIAWLPQRDILACPPINRRECLAALAAAPLLAAEESRFTRSICSVIFAPKTPVRDRLAVRFDVIELRLGVEVPMESSAAG